MSLNEQIIDEKLKIIKISQNRLNLFFKREKLQNTDRLTNFEQETKKHITILKNKVQSSIHEDQETFLKEIENLNLKISEKLRKQREELITEENKLYAHTKKGLNNFSKEGVDEEIIQKRVRQNKIEMKIGLSWINKIGIFLILLGVGFAAYYNREYIDDYLKGAFYFLLGIAFLIGGEILYRQKNDVFAKGLLGGGIAILYGSIFISCFMLKIISLNIGFLIAFIITSTAIMLSLRYNSKTIISFGLIGGYLPFFIFQSTTGFQGEMFYFGMGYLFILNLLVLLISFQKQWTILNFISFIFNIPCIIYLVFNCPNEIVGIFYSILVFGMYFIVILGYPFIKKTSLKAADIMLIAFNTIISTIIIYLLLEKAEFFYLRGYLALGFCLFYFGLARFLNKVMHQEKGTIILFYLTALTFAVLMIPFQFGGYNGSP